MNVMIIDDDENVRSRLKSLIDWKGLSAQLVCEARDSDTAKELFLLHRPKIVITDINIPVISGIDLAEELQQEDSEVRFIVITGYNDFEMAKRAFNLRTVNLLSKPIQADVINESIRKATAQIMEARENSVSMAALRQLVANNFPQIQQNYMENLLHGRNGQPDRIMEKLTQLKIPCHGPNYVVVLITLSVSNEAEADRETVTFLIRDLFVEETAAMGLSTYAFADAHMRVNCFINTPLDNPDNALEEALLRVKERIAYYDGAQLFAGIGSVVCNITEIRDSYSAAHTALKYQSVFGEENVVHFQNIEKTDVVLPSQDPVFKYLMEQFRIGNLEEIEKAIRKQIKMIQGSYLQDKTQMQRNFLLEYVIEITNAAMLLSLDINKGVQISSVFTHLFQIQNGELCVKEILTLTSSLIEQIQEKRDSSTNQIIAQAKSYIQDNLHDENLSLEQVSAKVALSKIYFCRLFHQTVGMSFVNYLKQERVELAKRLLLKDDLKVFEISIAAGFSSPKYFSYVFKQIVGMTPMEFKKKEKI